MHYFRGTPSVINENAGNHILFLHTKCKSDYRDYYMADMIFALIRMSRIVTLYTTSVDEDSPLNNIEDSSGKIKFAFAFRRLAAIRMRWLSTLINHFQVMCLVLQVILKAPSPRPSLIITDINSAAITILKTFTSYPVIYIKHFSLIDKGNIFSPAMTVPFRASTARSLRRADEIVVQTECLKKVMERSLPNLMVKITALNPCCDTGFWLQAPVDIKSILPRLPFNCLLYVVFIEYKSRSNIELIFDALEHFVSHRDKWIISRTRVAIAGFSYPLNADELAYYKDMTAQAKTMLCKKNFVFLKQTNITEQKSLINHCTAVLNPTNFNVYPGAILMAMNLKKPIVSVNNGFAAEVLELDVSAFLVESVPSLFSNQMYQLALNSTDGEDIAECAKTEFDVKFNYFTYRHRVNSMITRQINRHL